MKAYMRQKQKGSKHLATDSSKPSGSCTKSKLSTKKLELFGKYLLLTLGPMAYERKKRDKIAHVSRYAEPSIFTKNKRYLTINFSYLVTFFFWR